MATVMRADADIAYDRSRLVDVDLFGAVKRSPQEYFARWTTDAPFYVMFGDAPQAVVARHAEVQRCLEDYASFTSEKQNWPGVEKFAYFRGLPVVTDNDPPTHTRLRRLMAPAFSPRRLAAIEAELTDYVAALLDGIDDAGGFDAQADYGRKLSAKVLFGLLLGLPEPDWPIFLRLAHSMSGFNNLAPGAPPPAPFIAAWDEGRAYCEALIADQKRRPTDDVVGAIVAAHFEAGKISTDELFATMFVLYVAGQGGTANTVAWTLWRLCRNRDQLELLQREPDLAASTVDEGIRIDSNAYNVLRFAVNDTELGGVPIPRAMPVILMTGAPNFDAARHADPLRFDITRTARRDTMAFGYGVHHCIGMSLARTASRIAVGGLVRRFPGLHMADPSFHPDIIGGPKERGPASIPMLVR